MHVCSTIYALRHTRLGNKYFYGGEFSGVMVSRGGGYRSAIDRWESARDARVLRPLATKIRIWRAEISKILQCTLWITSDVCVVWWMYRWNASVTWFFSRIVRWWVFLLCCGFEAAYCIVLSSENTNWLVIKAVWNSCGMWTMRKNKRIMRFVANIKAIICRSMNSGYVFFIYKNMSHRVYLPYMSFFM